MNLKEAFALLGINPEAGMRDIKTEYRRLMLQYHPDTMAGDSLDEERILRRAQRINEAYTMIQNSSEEDRRKLSRETVRAGGSSRHFHWATFGDERGEFGNDRPDFRETREDREPEGTWEAEINPAAFGPRDIFFAASWHHKGLNDLHRAARGPYYWEPDLEEFRMLLFSVNSLSEEIIETAEDRMSRENPAFRKGLPYIPELRGRLRQDIFHLLMQQFIRPYECLEKLVRIDHLDPDGHEVYLVSAFLGIAAGSAAIPAAEDLTIADLLYPSDLQDNRLILSDGSGRRLGYLSFPDDRMYYLLMPLLRKKQAQVKITVREIKTGTGADREGMHIELDLFLKVMEVPEENEEAMAKEAEGNRLINLRIEELLDNYETQLGK